MYDLAGMLGYYPQNKAPSVGQVTITLDESATFPVTIPSEDFVFTVQTTTGIGLTFESPEIFTVQTKPTDFDTDEAARQFDITVYEGKTVGTAAGRVNIGVSDGVTEWQEFNLPDQDVILSNFGDVLSIRLLIGNEPWTLQETLVESGENDAHFRWITKPGGITAVQFGDGTTGRIPPANIPINAIYRVGGGFRGNISTTDSSIIYEGTNATISAVSFPDSITQFSGGSNAVSYTHLTLPTICSV